MATKLADYGTFGLYIIKFPSGKYGYVGTVPVELANIRFPDEATATLAFNTWIAEKQAAAELARS